MSRVDLALAVLAVALTVAILIPHLGLYSTAVQREVGVGSGGLAITISPNVTRYTTVYRADGSVETYVKVGDPPSLQWYSLLANWMFNLFDRTDYQGQNFRQPVIAITGSDVRNSFFETSCFYGSGSAPTLVPYFSDAQTGVDFTTYTVSPRYTGKTSTYEVAITYSDTSDSNYYRANITATYTRIAESPITLTIAFVTLRYTPRGSTVEIIFLIDALDPPITLNALEALQVTWVVEFPKQPPYTDAFWTVLRNFLALSNGPPDFGYNGGHSCTTRYPEDLRVHFMQGSTVLSTSSFSAVTLRVLGVTVENDGLYIRLRASYTPTASTTVDRVVLALRAVSIAGAGGSSTSFIDYYLFSFPIGPVQLVPQRPLVVDITIKFANLFSQ
ncbi:MAG: hypothetical protein QXQ90_05360 [Desulfurococcaceae archaeon]